MRKIKNPVANPDSKTQKKKSEYLKEHPVVFIKCEKCGDMHSTLYKVDDKYYCNKDIPKD